MTSTTVFLYGTLLDPEHRKVVLGQSVDTRTATLSDHAVVWDKNDRFPVLIDAPGQDVSGCLIDVDPDVLRRVEFYEAVFGYGPAEITVEAEENRLSAIAYLCDLQDLAGDRSFDLLEWRTQRGSGAIAGAAELMKGIDQTTADAAGRTYHSVLSRVWSYELAQTAAAPAVIRSDKSSDDYAIIASTRSHAGFFALDQHVVRHPTFAGPTLEITREVTLGFDAALVLPYDPKRDLVMLVEQFRAGPMARGDKNPWILEPVAGLIDYGETPQQAALRETREEAGLELKELVQASAGYAAPGATTEFHYLFVGIADLDPQTSGGTQFGVVEEGEDIRTHVLPLEDALELIETGEANVVPLQALILWVAAHKERLRALA